VIIQVRGTSGSGKSTVMRKVKDRLAGWESHYVEGRKKPLWYRRGNLYVLGHYESPCGGCDTIGSARQVYEVIQGLPLDATILCEGLLLSEDVKWSSQLDGLRALFLVTPVDICLERIEARRRAAGNDKPLNPANTVNRVATIKRARVRLRDVGVKTRRVSCSQALRLILRWIKGRP